MSSSTASGVVIYGAPERPQPEPLRLRLVQTYPNTVSLVAVSADGTVHGEGHLMAFTLLLNGKVRAQRERNINQHLGLELDEYGAIVTHYGRPHLNT